MGKVIGIDYGTKRIGLAISDELKMIATPLDTVHSKDAIDVLLKLVEGSDIEIIIIGIPIDLKGNETHATKLAQDFSKSLKRKFKQVQIIEVDERFTSKMAAASLIQGGVPLKKRKDKSLLDKISATIMLQSFLDYGV